jgi:hypothetical protein
MWRLPIFYDVFRINLQVIHDYLALPPYMCSSWDEVMNQSHHLKYFNHRHSVMQVLNQ